MYIILFIVICFCISSLLSILVYKKGFEDGYKKGNNKNILMPFLGMKVVIPSIGEVIIVDIKKHDGTTYVDYIQSSILKDRSPESLSDAELLDCIMSAPLDIFSLQAKVNIAKYE